MKSTIDLAAIQAFVKVVQAGSFTGAADTLHTHKAHLSRVVSQLERELGARLLERTTRSLALTEVGREFHERAQAILAAVDDARLAVLQSQGAPRGTLRLTCGVEFGMLAVGGWINRYLALYPQVKVEAEITGRLVDLVHEGFDLAIRVGQLPDSTLAARRLGSLTYALYAAPAYLQRRGRPQVPQELDDHDTLVFATHAARSSWLLSQGAEQHRLTPRPRLRASNSFTVRDAAAAGLGIAALPRLVGEPLVAEGRLQVVLPGWSPPEAPVHAVFASARFLAPKVRAFVDLAVQTFGETVGS
jgi:LysR family transcriptional regulator, regulator for bpeEF and oprC